MKVACIGNMNNMMFTLCRYLRDKDIDAHLFLFDDEAAHFLPQADSYDEEYKKYTIALPVGKNNLYSYNLKELSAIFEDCDFYIGTDIAPALLALLGKKINVFIPHGSDIYSYPFPEKPGAAINKIWWCREIYFVGLIQKIGIENADTILFPKEYDEYFPFKHKLKCTGNYYDTSGPMLYSPQYIGLNSLQEVTKLRYYDHFKKLREQYDLIVFSHSRQNGMDLPDHQKVHEKGNDILINGFANFISKNKKIESCLVLFEYGMDVNAAKQLVAKLGIDKQVVWMPKMERKEIMIGILNTDIACGEFKNSWLTCGVVNETLVLGKPLLHYRDDKLVSDNYPELYPVLNARSEEEIYNQLVNYIENKITVIDESKKGVEWIEKYTVCKPLEIVLEKIKNSSKQIKNLSITFLMRVLIIRFKLLIILNCYRLKEKLNFR